MAKLHSDQAEHNSEVTSDLGDQARTPAEHLDTGTDHLGAPGSSGAGHATPDVALEAPVQLDHAPESDDQNLAEEPTPDEAVAPDEAAAPDRVASLTERRRSALAEARRTGLPPKVDSWRKRTATGAVLTGFALGFREALSLEPQRPAIMMEAPGDPPTDLPVDAEVDQIRPADNVVRIRPWLLPNGSETAAETDTGTPVVKVEPDAPELTMAGSPLPEAPMTEEPFATVTEASVAEASVAEALEAVASDGPSGDGAATMSKPHGPRDTDATTTGSARPGYLRRLGRK